MTQRPLPTPLGFLRPRLEARAVQSRTEPIRSLSRIPQDKTKRAAGRSGPPFEEGCVRTCSGPELCVLGCARPHFALESQALFVPFWALRSTGSLPPPPSSSSARGSPHPPAGSCSPAAARPSPRASPPCPLAPRPGPLRAGTRQAPLPPRKQPFQHPGVSRAQAIIKKPRKSQPSTEVTRRCAAPDSRGAGRRKVRGRLRPNPRPLFPILAGSPLAGALCGWDSSGRGPSFLTGL